MSGRQDLARLVGDMPLEISNVPSTQRRDWAMFTCLGITSHVPWSSCRITVREMREGYVEWRAGCWQLGE